MPWVRIDENAMDHPKVAGLSDGAFRLWVQGLAYCQKFLTDGVITSVSMRGLRGYTGSKRDALLQAGLWESADGGVQVHDYLDWNESKEHVIQAREQARERMRKAREQRGKFARTHAERTQFVPLGVGGSSVSGFSEKTEEGAGETSLTARAGAFCEWYADEHCRVFGVGYMGTNSDYMRAQELCKVFSDEDLRAAALVWFGQDDKWATDGTRTIPKFASRASKLVLDARRTLKRMGVA